MMSDPAALTTSHSALPECPPQAFVGQSAAMQRLRAALADAASSRDPVLLRGESGAGKSLAGRVLHAMAAPASGTFIRIHCGRAGEAASREKLRAHLGRSARGERVTLFADEIGEAPPWLQEALSETIRSFNTRFPGSAWVISATSHDLELLARKGRFRADLLSRISAEVVWIPPLRVRRDDIADLVGRCVEPFAEEVEPAALELLERQAWPENVRQLKSVVRRVALLYGRLTEDRIARELAIIHREKL